MTASTTSAASDLQPGGEPSLAHPAVALESVTKWYAGENQLLALDGISLRVRPGEFLTLVGASGCGKSTLLNLVSGLDQPTSGSVDVDGHAAFMFQEHALFTWLSALDNVAAPLRLRGVGKKERVEQALDYLEAVHLADFADRRPPTARAVRWHEATGRYCSHPCDPGSGPVDG